MKKDSPKKHMRKKSEFRYHSTKCVTVKNKIINIRHPAYVFLEKDGIYVYVTITHSHDVKDIIVIKLNKNPNPNDSKDSFYVAEIRKDLKESFGKIVKGWEIEKSDDKKIRDLYYKKR